MPLSVQTTPDGDFIVISQCDVLLGKSGWSSYNMDHELDTIMTMEDY